MSYRAHRYPTVFPIELKCGGSTQKGHITNIAPSGAGVFDVQGLEIGDEVVLSCSAGNFAGTVRWADDDQCGIIFKQKLGPRQMEQLRHAPTTTGHVLHRHTHAFTELR
ncbi:PilZ domain-containing protein [Octadecabacter ascidiaceicola]|uniref:PilZ domain protein n=1 Tax=Octadecabacter ascidiaceicola TaxID=1655543 RepID=A0A238JTJ5_9RHOB|nr:PilZ domain-containing protein [Octadecabacter ascidiaceicola]SMX33517.1 PilZ domain protein [Octadecabacter ascidiaceicola]